MTGIASSVYPEDSRLCCSSDAFFHGGKYILLWIRRAQRLHFNYALNYAVKLANDRKLPLAAYFHLDRVMADTCPRQFCFMTEGLVELRGALREAGIPLFISDSFNDLIAAARASSVVVTDRAYLREERENAERIISAISGALIEVDSEITVPQSVLRQKEEYSAATFRPVITKQIPIYLKRIDTASLKIKSTFDFPDIPDEDLLKLSGRNDYKFHLSSGEREAQKVLTRFIEERLSRYDVLRNDPSVEFQSGLSPYLRFGQISVLDIAVAAAACGECASKFLDELIVRRELSFNFVRFNAEYFSYQSLPAWARRTLDAHRMFDRDYLYTPQQVERAQTHDRYWNAAQKELLVTGRMHGYMRMYWGKKIIEWSRTPEEAFATAMTLNNRYALDGSDPNSYAGVAWCFGKHDRPWGERRIFGMVRYMNDKGLKRKFDIERYCERIEELF